tara:strand:- start:102 stop:593 length:492 start_codon:yes stop_codon:yes gene_type:complete
MVKYLITIIISFFFIISCQKELSVTDTYQSSNKIIFIDTVQKNINLNGTIKGIYSDSFLDLLSYWSDNNIKTNGFDGLLEINLISISSSELLTENGTRVELELELDFIISKTALDSKTLINFKGNEFFEILGNFSLNEKNIEVKNIMKKLVDRLSYKLSKEIS